MIPEPKPKKPRNNMNHPWKSSFSWSQVKTQKERRKAIERIEGKHAI